MIALDLPTSHGIYSNPGRPVVVHGELRAVNSKIENGAVISLDALSRVLRDIDGIGESVQPNEDIPTAFAQSIAKRLLLEAQTIRPIYLMPSTIEGSDGDLLIHWDTASKSVVLICSAVENREPQIYKERLDGSRATHSEMGVASSDILSAALAWVLQPK